MFLKSTRNLAAMVSCVVIMLAYLVTQLLLVSGRMVYEPWLGFFGLGCIICFFPLFIYLVSAYGRQVTILRNQTAAGDKEAQQKRVEELEKFVDEASIVSKADAKGKITYVNKKFTEVSGYTLAEVIGKDHSVVNSGIHPKEMWKDMYKTVIKDRGIWNQVVTNRAKNGSLYFVDTYIKAEFDPTSDDLIGYTSIRQDLTELKNKEQDIRVRMEAINKSNAVIEFDTDRKIIFANEIFCKVFGYNQQDIKGKEHRMLVKSEYASSPQYQQFWDTLLSGKNLQSQYERVKKDGSTVWLEATYNPVFDANGKLVRILKIATNVTEKVLQGIEIKNKEQEIRSRMDALNKSNAVIEFDTDRKIIFANEIFCKVFGYNQQDIKGKEHRMLVRPEYAASPEYEQFWNTLLSGKNLQAQYERVKKDGSTIWLEATYNPVFDANGKLVRILKIATDVTEKVLQQKNIEDQKNRFGELVNFINESAIVSRADAKGKITYVNKKFTQVSGYTLEEVVGKDHNIVNSGFHPKEMWLEMYKKVIKEKGIWNKVVTNRAKNGQLYYVDTYIKGEFDPVTGALVEYTSIRQDMTELKRKELEIVNRMNAINKSNAVVEFDIDGNIMYANDQFCKTLGYTMEELRGKHHQMFVSRSFAESIEYTEFWGNLRKGRHLSAEFERIKKDGNTVWFQATYNPIINNEGHVKRVIKIAVDITSRIKQSEEIQKKNTYLEHAAKILRHDMHSGINTYIPRGISSLKLRLNPEVIESLRLDPPLRMLTEGLSHAQKVYKGVFEFTNLVKTDSKLNLVELNLGEILREFLSTTAYKKQVIIEDLITVPVSEQLFCTAVDNLIRNGLKYNDSPNKLVKVYMGDPDTLVVEDNGRGITQEEFINFSSKNLRRENQKESGSGLGLGICVAILKEHNFEIHCTKNETVGTTITIKLRKS